MAPKLNSHCWYDMKLAAAKKPDLTEVKERKRGSFQKRQRNRRKGREMHGKEGWLEGKGKEVNEGE